MAGGFLKQHKIRDCSWENCDEPKPDDHDEEYDYFNDGLEKRRRRRAANEEEYHEPVGGGTTNGQTWMFEGKDWTKKAEIPTPRDRPSCSLVNMPNGKVKFRSKLDFR